jgi:hypothetical protein
MEPFFEYMSQRDGVAAASDARAFGVTWDREQHLVDVGVIERPAPGVLRSVPAPVSWNQRVRIAALAPGDAVISHGAAARLHQLDGFDRYASVDVLCRKGWCPNCPADTITHFTRGLDNPDLDVVEVDGIRTLSTGATLALLKPACGVGLTARALDSALRLGNNIDDLRATARRWQRRGRSGPRTLLMLLDEREGKTLPPSWFQRLAKRIFAQHLVRFVDGHEVRAWDGTLLAVLDLAHPTLKIGVECQSWAWHATPEAQHRDARRRGQLRQQGWEIVDVWWRDLDRPTAVSQELGHLIQIRTALSRTICV